MAWLVRKTSSLGDSGTGSPPPLGLAVTTPRVQTAEGKGGTGAPSLLRTGPEVPHTTANTFHLPEVSTWTAPAAREPGECSLE